MFALVCVRMRDRVRFSMLEHASMYIVRVSMYITCIDCINEISKRSIMLAREYVRV